jgi:hypothetical protein
LDGKTNRSLFASNQNRVRDLRDEYSFHDDGDDFNNRKDLPSITHYVNGNGLLNSNNILQKAPSLRMLKMWLQPRPIV